MDILLIDDELELRETLSEVLKEAGHTITEIGDGNAAADLLETDLNLKGAKQLTGSAQAIVLSSASPTVARRRGQED